MALTLLDYRASVRRKLDDSSYESDSIDEAINWYVSDVFNRIKTRLMEASDELFVGIGDTEVEFPDDFQELINLSVTNPSPARFIMDNYMEYGDFVNTHPNYAAVTAQAVATADWTDFGNMMRLSAPAKIDSTLFIEYLRVPVDMASDTDECEVPDPFRRMVTIGALAEIMERNEDYEEATVERRKLTGEGGRPGLEDLFAKRYARGRIKTGPTIIRTRRGRRGGYRVDRDFQG
jgi:hypothetical protein